MSKWHCPYCPAKFDFDNQAGIHIAEVHDYDHQHEYTIPVEWSYESHENGDGLANKSVTKLRCSCGEEVSR